MKIISPITFLSALFLFFISNLLYTGKFKVDNLKAFKLDIVENKVIHPQCFSHLTYDVIPNHSVVYVDPDQLINCDKYSKNKIEISNYFISSDYPRDENLSYRGYAGYSVGGKLKDGSYILELFENGGGTGHFSSIWQLKKEINWNKKIRKLDELIKIKYIGGSGDRCNGGASVTSVKEDHKGEYIEMTSNITAFMFVEEKKPSLSLYYIEAIAKKNMTAMKKKFNLNVMPYYDLANCANCCAGYKKIKRYLNKPDEIVYELHNKTTGVFPEIDLSSQGKYQECFNNLVTDKIKENGHKKFISLNQNKADSLRKEFYQECAQPVLEKEKELEKLQKLVLSYDNERLCKAALKFENNKEWDYSSEYSNFAVNVALNKGLDCGTGLFLGRFNHLEVCDKATTIDNKWTDDKDLIEFVNEAKKLELDCSKILKISSNN